MTDCECDEQTLNNLDNAIRLLLQRGKHVNRMMDNEKAIRQAKKLEEVNALKKNIQVEETQPSKQRLIFNKRLGSAEVIDFDIPSLVYESSPPLSSSSKKKIPSSTSYTTTEAVTTKCSTVTRSKGLVLYEHYIVEQDGKSMILPLKVLIKGNELDGSLDVFLAFLDKSGEKLMDISLNLNEKKVQDVKFCGKQTKMDP